MEYRTAYLAALVKVMTAGGSLPQQPVLSTSHVHQPLLQCLELLFMNLEDQKRGPEFLSQALSAAGLLISQCPKARFQHFSYILLFCLKYLFLKLLFLFFLIV